MARHIPGDVPRAVLSKYGELGRKVIELWEFVRSSSTGDPAPHHLTHMVGGSDQFPKPPAPLTVLSSGSADAGLGAGFMRQDAQLIVGAAAPSVEVKPEPASAGVASTVLRSDAKLTLSLLSVRAFLPHERQVPQIQAGTNVTLAYNAAGVVISASGGGGTAVDDASNILATQVFGG